jgi:calcineurin-like phosphoesterase family protein
MHAKLKEYPEIKKVAFVAGAHLDQNKEASSKMLYDTMQVFRNYDTQLLLTHDPDKDFYYMCHSKYFMKSGGGFSNLIEAYVRENGGIVFSEKDKGTDPRIPIR